jgi:hypothetical protein
MKSDFKSTRSWKRLAGAIVCLVAVSSVFAAEEAEDNEHQWGPALKLSVEVRNRLYPDFFESHNIEMNERVQVGDTDYFIEVVDFFPHFAIIDSTKETVSLSHEPKNVAFKFVVYESDSIVDATWSFYSVQIPHYARTSYLYFNITKFEYRGEVFSKKDPEQANEL